MVDSKLSSVRDVFKFSVKSHLRKSSCLRIYDEIYQLGAIRSFSISAETDDIRGNHSHVDSRQWFLAIQGSINVEVRDGSETKTFSLQRGDDVLFVPAGIWSIQMYKKNSTLLVFTDTQFSETDYIRSFEEFKRWKTK
jgi:hypothetical protein